MPHKQFKLVQVPDLQPARERRSLLYNTRVVVAFVFGVFAMLSVLVFSLDRFFIVSSFQVAVLLLLSSLLLGSLLHFLSRADTVHETPDAVVSSLSQCAVAKAMVDAVNRADATGQQHHEIDVLSAISHQMQHADSAVILTKDMGVVHKHLRSRFTITTRGFGYTPMYTRLSLALRDSAPTQALRA